MKGILLLACSHLATVLRERVSLFWFLIFPVLLLAILAVIFGRSGQEGEVQFSIALVNEEPPAAAGSFSSMIDEIFTRMAIPPEEGGEPIFVLSRPGVDEDPRAFFERAKQRLSRGDLAAVIVIPKGFDAAVVRTIGPEGDGGSTSVEIYLNQNDVGSQMAAGIIEQVILGINRGILIRSGRLDPSSEIESETGSIGGTRGEVSYIDFLLPGIIMMGFFTGGLFSVPGTILLNRDLKILRRYWVTPFTVPRYLAGFSLGHLAVCALQFAVIYTVGRYAFGARLNFVRFDTVLLLLLAVFTFMAVGFLIASIAKTANGGMAMANILNMPMMFLSGLFFPISGLPIFLLALVYANPVTYLIDRLRASLELGTPIMPAWLTVVVPLFWIVLSLLVTAKRLSWDVER